MPIGGRDSISVHQDDLAHAEMRKLVSDMASAAAQAHNPYPSPPKGALAIVANDEKLPGEVLRVLNRRPRLPRRPLDDRAAEPPHVGLRGGKVSARHGDQPISVSSGEHDRSVWSDRDTGPKH